MRPEPILILGGTGDARALASRLVAERHDVITSLAGVTAAPVLPDGRMRRGGFGGAAGLAAFLKDQGIAALVDATHPFAAQMSRQAHEAAEMTGIPLLRLERPAWIASAGDNWIHAASVAEAARVLPPNARAFVAIGRKEIAAFFARGDLSGVARMMEIPDLPVPPQWKVILQRPPFDEEAEIHILAENRLTHVVAKNAGGTDTFAKIIAARHLPVPVVMIARPFKPPVHCFPTVNEIFSSLCRVLLP